MQVRVMASAMVTNKLLLALVLAVGFAHQARAANAPEQPARIRAVEKSVPRCWAANTPEQQALIRVTAANAINFSILQGQPLGMALRTLASQAGTNLTFDESAVAGKTAAALQMQGTLNQALEQLLKDTGLEWCFLNEATVIVGRAGVPPFVRINSATRSAGSITLAQNSAEGTSGAGRGVAQGQNEGADGDSSLEEIVVTGTRIRGTAPIGSNVVTVGVEAIAESGANTVDRLMQQLPMVSSLGFSEGSKGGTSGGTANRNSASGVNLRGIGRNATLTLLNGHRFPLGGNVVSDIADPSMLPAVALQRVEIFADGGSAVYGSDAVAGVVNFVLRRDVDGIEVGGGYGWADGYFERSYSLVGGKNWGSGRFMLAFEDNFHSALSGLDRDYSRKDLTPFGGTDQRVTSCSLPGTVLIGTSATAAIAAGATYPIPVTSGPVASSQLVQGAINRCDPNGSGDILPQQHRYGGVFTFDQELTDGIKFIADGYFGRREFEQTYTFSQQNLTVPSTNAFYVLPQGVTLAAGQQEFVTYDNGANYGDKYPFWGYSTSYQVSAGLEFTLPADWRIETSALFSRAQDFSDSRNFNTALANSTYLRSSDPAVALDPYSNRTSQATRDALLSLRNAGFGQTGQKIYAASADGPLLALPGGDMLLAAGLEYTEFSNRNFDYSATYGSPPNGMREFSRYTQSAYTELALPLVGSGNALPAVKKLDLSLAARYSRYSDFGGTTNPKIGLSWMPFDSLTVRGSYSTAFRAPSVREIKGAVSASSSTLTVINPGGPGVALFLIGGNPNLQPEKAKTYSFGADFEPSRALKLGLTWWSIDYTNQIISVFANQGVLSGTLYSSLVQRTFTQADINNIVAQYPNAAGTPTVGSIAAIVDGSYFNLGATKMRGFDLAGSYQIPADRLGLFTLSPSITYLTEYQVQTAPGGPYSDQLNNLNYPVKLRGRGGVSWSKGGYSAALNLNYVGSYDDKISTPNRKVDSWTTADLYLAYTLGDSPNLLLRDTTLALNVSNLSNADPPFVNLAATQFTAGGYDPQQASAIGRMVSVSLRKKF